MVFFLNSAKNTIFKNQITKLIADISKLANRAAAKVVASQITEEATEDALDIVGVKEEAKEAEAAAAALAQEAVARHEYSAFKHGTVWRGLLCPSMSNSFRAKSLERSYLTYTHRQRQKSLILVNIVDLVLKIALAVVWSLLRNNSKVRSRHIPFLYAYA